MQSETHGVDTLAVEVTNISQHGFWLLFRGNESFLPFDHFPWFKNAPVSAILNVEMVNERHLYWPELDVDLAVESIGHPELFPLISKAHSIVIGVGFANLAQGVNLDALRESLVSEVGDFQTYSLAPASPGHVRAAAFDLMLLLSATGSVASVAALLWMAYEKFIAPKKTDPRDNAGIYISIRRPDGSTVDFWIGNKQKNREAFIAEFSRAIAEMRASDDPSFWREAAAEVQETETWILYK